MGVKFVCFTPIFVMNLEKNYKIGGLFYFYKGLLTEKQANIFESYYFNDNSLSEIGARLKISRQAVKDSLNTTENLLTKYEEILNLNKIFYSQQNLVDNLIDKNENLKQDLEKIIKVWEN